MKKDEILKWSEECFHRSYKWAERKMQFNPNSPADVEAKKEIEKEMARGIFLREIANKCD